MLCILFVYYVRFFDVLEPFYKHNVKYYAIMYHIYLDYGGNQRDEKVFPHFNAVIAFIESIRFPPKRIHIIFLNSH